MKTFLVFFAFCYSLCLHAYEEPSEIKLAKHLYEVGCYSEALEMFNLYYLKHDGSTPPCAGIDAYIGRMACYLKLGHEEEYSRCVDTLASFLFDQATTFKPGSKSTRDTAEFSEMFNESLFQEIYKATPDYLERHR